MSATARSLRSARTAPVTPKSKSRGSGTIPPKKKPKASKTDKGPDAFITQDAFTTRLDDLKDDLKGALLDALNDKRKPPQPPVVLDDEDSSDGSSGSESSDEDELPRKTSMQRALQALEGLDAKASAARPEASAARSAAKAALRRAEATAEIARRRRLELTPPTPAPKKSTSRQQDEGVMPDDSDEDEEQLAGVENSLLQSLLAKVEALANAKDRSDNKGASSDTEARTIALIASAKAEQEKQARDLSATPFSDFGNKEKAKSLSTLALSQGVINDGLIPVGSALADMIGDGSCPSLLLDRLGAVARSVDELRAFNVKSMEETERMKQITVLGDIYGHEFTAKPKALFYVTYNGEHAKWKDCLDAATRMFKGEGGRGGSESSGTYRPQARGNDRGNGDTSKGTGGKTEIVRTKGGKQRKKKSGDGGGK